VPPGLLFDREVPDEAGMRAMFPQHCFLGSGRYQTVAGHSNIISIICAFPGKRIGVSSGHEQGAFRPRHLDVRAGLGCDWTWERRTSDDGRKCMKAPRRQAEDTA
jgi:hypothetical protein